MNENELKPQEDLEGRLGDWELNTSDPLSPLYKPTLKDRLLRVYLRVKSFYNSLK